MLPYDLRDEVSLLQRAGFRTDRQTWTWHTTKASTLNKLRKYDPKSGLAVTELALEKYKPLDQQEKTKRELKKKFQKLQQAAQAFHFEEYLDQELQIVCFVVKPVDAPFVWDYHPPAPPTKLCLGCDDPMYFPFDDRAYCIWCEKVENSA